MCIAVTIENNSKDDSNNKQEIDHSPEESRVYHSILTLIHNIGIWLCIRYNYRLPILLLLQNVIFVVEPITYFYNFIKPGR